MNADTANLQGERKKTMRAFLVLLTVCFSMTALAQSPPPKTDNKPPVHVRSKEPMGCKLVGTVRGCAYRKSNPAILMVQSAQDRAADDIPGPLNAAMDRGILVQ
jgi:hypothetical protein